MTKSLLGIYAIALSIVVLSTSCDKMNKSEAIPAFIKIDSIGVSTNSSQGTSSSNITEAWVYIDGQQQGIYDLPVVIPILEEGTHTVQVRGGIKRDGISTTRIRYPFYDAYTTDIDFKAKDTTHLKPVLPYFSSLRFWEENFEDPGVQLDTTNNSQAQLGVTYDVNEVFEGSASGKIILKDENKYFGIRTNQNFSFPLNQAVFVELNYKTDGDMQFGIFADGVAFNMLFLRSKRDENGLPVWNKIYINLTEYITLNSSSTSFDIFLQHSSETTSEKVFLIDNIKIIHP